LEDTLAEWAGAGPQGRKPISWLAGADSETKTEMMNEEPNGVYTVELPNAAADVVLTGDVQGVRSSRFCG